MNKQEDTRLADMKRMFDDIPIPSSKLDDAIQAGFLKAKSTPQKRNRKKTWLTGIVAAAILLLGFFATIRSSPTFANYISAIPGMEKLVELVQHDKGMLSAVEHNYYQKLDVSQMKNGTKFSIDGVIADENGIIIFYTVHSKEKQTTVSVSSSSLDLKAKTGKQPVLASISSGYSHHARGERSHSGTLEIFYQTPLTAKELELSVKVQGDSIREDYKIPFALTKSLQEKKVYHVNKPVEIEGQKLTIQDITVYPLRVAVHLKMDPSNQKQLLEFTDMRLVDEKREVWSKIMNGLTASNISEDERIIYLQSNYFHEPKKLYLVLNKIQAINKDEKYLIVDTETEKIIKQPKANIFNGMKVEGSELLFDTNVKNNFRYGLFSEVKDGDGRDVEISSSGSEGRDDQFQRYNITIPNVKQYKNPLSIELSFFPTWIEGDVQIRVK